MTMSPEVVKLVKDLNKKLGDGTVVIGDEITEEVVPRMTSGSLSLDMILGGGWPCNQAVEIVGESSHGKSAIALKTIAANQELNPEFVAVWVAAEEWVPSYAEMCGVDLKRVIVVETNIMEHALESVIQFASTKAVDAIVIDSLPALVPLPEDEKDMESMTVGKGALLINKFFRKVGKALKRSLIEHERPVLLIVINQYRMRIGVMMGDPRTTPGGQGKDYAYFVRCEVKRDSWIEVGPTSNKTKVGQGIRVRTIKNKSAPPQRTAYIDFYFAEGGDVPSGDFDFGKELVAMAALTGVLTRGGAWYTFGEHKWQGADAVVQAVREDIDLREQMEKEVREHPLVARAVGA